MRSFIFPIFKKKRKITYNLGEQNTAYKLFAVFLFLPWIKNAYRGKEFSQMEQKSPCSLFKNAIFRKKIVALTELHSPSASVMAIWQTTY